jgi:hypothetical protein
MSPEQAWSIGAWTFRIVVVLVGLIIIYMGYRLFTSPVPGQANAGLLEASHAGSKLSLQGAAGTFLVVLGTIVILVGLLKPMHYDWKRRGDVGNVFGAQDSGHVYVDSGGVQGDTSRAPR